MPEPIRSAAFVRGVDLDALAAAGATEREVHRLIDATGGVESCRINVIRTPAGGGSPEGRHTHAVDQIFFILAGVMNVEAGADRFEAGPGSLVVLPAGVPHRNWNDGAVATIHLAIAAPAPDPDRPFATPAE